MMMVVMHMMLMVFVMFVTHCCWFLVGVYAAQKHVHTEIGDQNA